MFDIFLVLILVTGMLVAFAIGLIIGIQTLTGALLYGLRSIKE